MADKIQELRSLVFAEIKKSLEEDGHCKSYEGLVKVVYPHYFDRDEPRYCVELHCYLIGPARHYEWWGASIDEACDKAIADVKKWTTEEYKEVG